jgi:UDP-2,4-diacetamido-2,4,6-trideoxy-beta-L-altropyranose hydrolase
MRCLALAQAWKRDGATATFLLPQDPSGLAGRILAEGFLVEILPREPEQALRALANHSDCSLAVLDGYGLGTYHQSVLRDGGLPVLFLDDYGHAEHYSAQWVLNQNLSACPELYSHRNNDTRLLLGPAYALLREEFSRWTGWKRSINEDTRKILITMGGSDAGNVSTRIVQSLAKLGGANIEAVLVAGPGNPHLASLQEAVKHCAPVRVRIIQNVRDMPALMAWADVAIGAAGGTSYELCFMGLPSVLFVAAENQRGVAESLAEMGATLNAGPTQALQADRFLDQLRTLLQSATLRQSISCRGRELVDGLGAQRVRAAIMGRDLRIRSLRESDCELLFAWANDPATRAVSFHPAPIAWEHHTQWFRERLQDPQCVMYIGENGSGIAVGQVRFQLHGKRAVLSVSVAPEFRGKGWGTELIAFSLRSLVRTHFIERVDAFVKPDNQASRQVFEKNGFRQSANEVIEGDPALRYVWECKVEAHAD